MKTAVRFLAVLLIVGCGSSDPMAVQKQIDKKKAQISKIEQQIAELQKEQAATADTVTNNDDSKLITVQEVAPGLFSHYIEVQGMLDGDNNVAVYPETMGTIEEITVRVGQHVSKGQILARMNNAAYKEQLKGLKTSLDLATTVYEKQKKLWEQNIGSEVQYLQAKNNKETLEAQVAGLQEQIDMTEITSPINGTVEESSVKLGQTASPQMPAFRVVNFGHLKVVGEVAEAYASKIKAGDQITVYLPDIKKEYHARVSFASNYINQVNRTFHVEARLDESDNNMKANMVAVLKINDYRNDKAVVLPINYVQQDQKGDFVYIARNEGEKLIAAKKFVTLGQIYNGEAEIKDGLNQGDKVITSGYLDLEEGEAVRL
jgi:membrane fusion protein (multidrug efflux system)